MFDDYTTFQLIELRHRCADSIQGADDAQQRTAALLILKHIDEELAIRQQKQSA